MSTVEYAMSAIDKILALCRVIFRLAQKVHTNKEQCQRVAKRVKAFEELFLSICQRGVGMFSDTVMKALQELLETLSTAENLLKKYNSDNGLERFFKASNYEGKFSQINERLNDSYQVLSMALQIEQLDMACNTGYGASPVCPVPVLVPNMLPPVPVVGPIAAGIMPFYNPVPAPFMPGAFIPPPFFW